MRHMTFGIIVFTVATLCGQTRADFVGLVAVREFPNHMIVPGLVRDVFRIYAEFTNPNDRVDSWYGTQANPFVIQNVLANGTPGSGFLAGGSSFPPEAPGSPLDWETWATIGTTYENEMGQGSFLGASSFPPFINGTQVTSSVGSIFLTSPSAPDGLGSFRISGADTALRTLVMQLTVIPGEHVQGVINIGGRIVSDGGYANFTALSASFSSIPSPASVLILITAGLHNRRRR